MIHSLQGNSSLTSTSSACRSSWSLWSSRYEHLEQSLWPPTSLCWSISPYFFYILLCTWSSWHPSSRPHNLEPSRLLCVKGTVSQGNFCEDLFNLVCIYHFFSVKLSSTKYRTRIIKTWCVRRKTAFQLKSRLSWVKKVAFVLKSHHFSVNTSLEFGLCICKQFNHETSYHGNW